MLQILAKKKKSSPEFSAVYSLQSLSELKFKCTKNHVSFEYIYPVTHPQNSLYLPFASFLHKSFMPLKKFQVNITEPPLEVMFFISI